MGVAAQKINSIIKTESSEFEEVIELAQIKWLKNEVKDHSQNIEQRLSIDKWKLLCENRTNQKKSKMFKSKKILFSMVILIIVISACNLPGGQPPISNATPDLVLTITAQALLLQTPLNSQPPPESTLTPAVPGQVIGTDTPAFTATTTLTPTSSIPMLTVSADTNCRSGPNKDYAYLGVLLINETAEIVGKNTVTNYWIIKNPDAVGTCWLWGNYATVSGDTSKLAEVPIPPTPTPSIPDAVKNLKANKICFFNGVSYDLSGFITWEDGPNEAGYRIFVNGELFSTVALNVTSSAIPNLVLAPGGSIKMSVEAYNSTGKSPQKSVEIFCP